MTNEITTLEKVCDEICILFGAAFFWMLRHENQLALVALNRSIGYLAFLNIHYNPDNFDKIDNARVEIEHCKEMFLKLLSSAEKTVNAFDNPVYSTEQNPQFVFLFENFDEFLEDNKLYIYDAYGEYIKLLPGKYQKLVNEDVDQFDPNVVYYRI